MKASDLLLRCLEKEGVKYIFGIPGEETRDLMFSIKNSKIKFITTRHEQAAAFMAEVYGRLTAKPGVCLSTLGPGATNLITGIADSNLDKSPLIAITGQVSSKNPHKEAHQYLNIYKIFKPIVKWNISVKNPNTIPSIVRNLFYISKLEKPGATHVELPEDIAKLNTNSKPLAPKEPKLKFPQKSLLDKAIRLLRKSTYPLIISGNGTIRTEAYKELRKFVKKTHIPVITTFMGKGAISDKDEHSLFSLGLPNGDFSIQAIEKADLIITIGYDLIEYSPENWNSKKDKTIIHIDTVKSIILPYYKPKLQIIGNISYSLNKLNKLDVSFDKHWFKGIREKFIAGLTCDYKKLSVPETLSILRDVMKDDDILISDIGMHKLWIARNFLTYEPNTCIIFNGLSSMGVAVPGGIAAKLVYPKKNIVVCTGDGGFLMNSQEIETAVRLNLSYVIIVFNNNNYELITWEQENSAGTSFGTKILNPNFKKYAESFEIKAYSPKNIKELKENIKKSLNSNKLSLIEVKIDEKLDRKLFKNLLKQKC